MLESYKTDSPRTPVPGRASLYFTEANVLNQIDSDGNISQVGGAGYTPNDPGEVVQVVFFKTNGTSAPSDVRTLYSKAQTTPSIARIALGVFRSTTGETFTSTDGIIVEVWSGNDLNSGPQVYTPMGAYQADGVIDIYNMVANNSDGTNPLVDTTNQWLSYKIWRYASALV